MIVEHDGEEFGVVGMDLESSMKVQVPKMEQMVGILELSIRVVVAVG